METNFSQLEKVKKDLLNFNNSLTKQLEQLTNGGFADKLAEVLGSANVEGGDKKRFKIKKMSGEMILTKTGDVILRFDKKEEGRSFFDSVK